MKPTAIVNLSELDPSWNWLAPTFAERDDLSWRHVSMHSMPVPHWLPRRHTLQRISAAWATRALLSPANSVLVSHGPRMAMYGAYVNRLRREPARHLAYAFNFTNLPTGANRKAMRLAFRHVEKFVVFSQMERSLYSEYFDIPLDRIDMLHWSIAAPAVPSTQPTQAEADYICAIGSQGRDYKTLFDAMRLIPNVKLVVVAATENVDGLSPPSNIVVRTHIPIAQAHDIMANSRFMILPLSGSRVPCGHVTLVSAMQFEKAIVATDSDGISDYLADGSNGRLVAPGNPVDLARTIEQLWAAPAVCRQMGGVGKAFAQAHCTESRVVDYFAAFLGHAQPRI